MIANFGWSPHEQRRTEAKTVIMYPIFHISKFKSSNTDGLFTIVNSNSFLSNNSLGKFSYHGIVNCVYLLDIFMCIYLQRKWNGFLSQAWTRENEVCGRSPGQLNTLEWKVWWEKELFKGSVGSNLFERLCFNNYCTRLKRNDSLQNHWTL